LSDDRKRFGKNIEDLAAKHLEEKGYEILERNFHAGHKEIDIIAKTSETVVFVEVKASRQLRFGHPSLRVTKKQRANIITAARKYINDNMLEGYDFRLDVVSFYPEKGGKYILEHTEGAFMA